MRWIYSGKVKAERSIAGRWSVPESEISRLLGREKPELDKRSCLIYARVSSHKQKDNLKSQVERLTKHASEKGYEIVNVYEEVASGMNFIVEDLDSDKRKLGFELASIQDRTRLSLKILHICS
ncbi:MAG: recombinase family protein [Conexivisphaerales archaeon]